MKLLLTSDGVNNKSITKALFELVGKKPEDTSLVFVPTASNIEIDDKEWLIDHLIDLKNLKLKSLDIADISVPPEGLWKEKMENADILFFDGGNTYHLMEWVNKSGLIKVLPDLLKTKVWVGVSAGSMITNPSLLLKISQVVYDEDFDKKEEMQGLNFVDFYILPHFNSPWFPKIREDLIKKVTGDIKKKVYALDDQSAIKIDGDKMEIISEGEWFEVN